MKNKSVHQHNPNNKKSKKNIIYGNQKYTLRQWYTITSQFSRLDETALQLRNNTISLTPSQICGNFQENVKKHTFLGLILPSITFLFLSLITLTIVCVSQWGRFSHVLQISTNTQIIALFFASVLLLMGTGLLYKWLVLHDVCYFTKIRHHVGYHHIKQAEYDRIMEIMHMHIKKEFIFFSPIETERIIIRELKDFDSNDYYEMASNPNVCRYLAWRVTQNRQEVASIIENAQLDYRQNNLFKLAIEDKTTKKMVGYIGLSRYDLTEDTCQIVYAISEANWHKGYASEAVRLFIPYLKSQGKERILAGHVDKNETSGKVLLKNGFVRDNTRDHQMMIHGVLENIKMYAIDERKIKL